MSPLPALNSSSSPTGKPLTDAAHQNEPPPGRRVVVQHLDLLEPDHRLDLALTLRGVEDPQTERDVAVGALEDVLAEPVIVAGVERERALAERLLALEPLVLRRRGVVRPDLDVHHRGGHRETALDGHVELGAPLVRDERQQRLGRRRDRGLVRVDDVVVRAGRTAQRGRDPQHAGADLVVVLHRERLEHDQAADGLDALWRLRRPGVVFRGRHIEVDDLDRGLEVAGERGEHDRIAVDRAALDGRDDLAHPVALARVLVPADDAQLEVVAGRQVEADAEPRIDVGVLAALNLLLLGHARRLPGGHRPEADLALPDPVLVAEDLDVRDAHVQVPTGGRLGVAARLEPREQRELALAGRELAGRGARRPGRGRG